MLKFTTLNEKNYGAFMPLLPMELARRFETEGSLHGFGAVEENTACGILVYEFDDIQEARMSNIKYIAVAEGRRKKGVAAAMLDRFTEISYNNMIYPMCVFSSEDYDTPIYRLFNSNPKYSISEESGIETVFSGKMIIEKFEELSSHKSKLSTIDQCLSGERAMIASICRENGIMLDSPSFFLVPKACPVIMNDTKPVGFAIVMGHNDGSYDISFLYNTGSKTDAVNLIKSCIAGLMPLLTDDTVVYLSAVSEEVTDALENMFGDRMNITAKYYVASYEG